MLNAMTDLAEIWEPNLKKILRTMVPISSGIIWVKFKLFDVLSKKFQFGVTCFQQVGCLGGVDKILWRAPELVAIRQADACTAFDIRPRCLDPDTIAICCISHTCFCGFFKLLEKKNSFPNRFPHLFDLKITLHSHFT